MLDQSTLQSGIQFNFVSGCRLVSVLTLQRALKWTHPQKLIVRLTGKTFSSNPVNLVSIVGKDGENWNIDDHMIVSTGPCQCVGSQFG